jgi:hypothetical protein
VAACAVREFANTAIRMPMYPAAIEQAAPIRKPKDAKNPLAKIRITKITAAIRLTEMI